MAKREGLISLKMWKDYKMKNIEELGNEIAELEEEIRENTEDSKYQRTKRGALNRRRIKLENDNNKQI